MARSWCEKTKKEKDSWCWILRGGRFVRGVGSNVQLRRKERIS